MTGINDLICRLMLKISALLLLKPGKVPIMSVKSEELPEVIIYGSK